MKNASKTKRINQAIEETNNLLVKAARKYDQSVTTLNLEIAENKALGNHEDENDNAREYCYKCEKDMNWLGNHIITLEDRLN